MTFEYFMYAAYKSTDVLVKSVIAYAGDIILQLLTETVWCIQECFTL